MVENGTVDPYVYSDKPECRALEILSSFVTGTRHFDQAMDSIGLTCPACDQSFSASIPQCRVEGILRSGLPKSLFVEILELLKLNCRSTSQAQATSPGE